MESKKKNPNYKKSNQKDPNQKNQNQKNPYQKYQKNDNIKLNSSEKTAKGKVDNSGKSEEKPITDWFYMTPGEINAKDIADLIKLKSNLQVDLWEEMNILQIELPGKTTVDFESMDNNFKDPSDAAFIKNRNIKTIFAVTMEEGPFDEMKAILKLLLEEFEGFLCADSVDFKPIYDHENL